MADVYIHIGAPKTATSTLQEVLAGQSSRLLKQGVLYPERCRSGNAHHVLVCDLIEAHHGNRMPDVWYGDYPRGQAWPALADEIASHGDKIHSVVVSSELFFGQTRNLRAMLEDIRDRLPGHRVRIVAYLRRQDQLYGSFYNQDVKGARQWPGTAYQFYATHQIFQRDYFSLMKSYGAVFGEDNILVRPFEPAQWQGGDIVSDFCAATGLPALAAGSLERNESLGLNQLYIKQALNRIEFDKTLNDEVLRVVLKLCPEEPARNIMYVNKRPYMRLRHDWLETNRKLAQRFLGQDEFFQQPIPTAAQLTPFETEDDQLLAYLGRLAPKLRKKAYPEFASLLARGALLVIAEQDLWQRVSESDLATLMESARS